MAYISSQSAAAAAAGYWAKDLSSTDVDPHFGSEADLKTLIATARKKGECTGDVSCGGCT
jgi:glycosidase